MIFDLWHIVKLGIPYEKVMKFPKQYFIGVEINDGYLKTPAGMTIVEETTGHRELCGYGEFDVKGFMEAPALAVSRAGRHRGALEGAAHLAAGEDGDHCFQHHARTVPQLRATSRRRLAQ